MRTSRRQFLQTTGLGAAGMLLMPYTDLFSQTPFALPRKSPESQGVESEGILNFLKAVKESGLEWHSFMLVRHGNIVAEGWWKPFESAYKHTLYSLSKSFTSTAIGFLVKEGKITVEDPVIKFFPEETPTSPSDYLKSMKVKHLLTMNTGQNVDTLPAMRDNTSQSWVKTFLLQPVEHEPGSFFMYNTGATYMLGAIVHKMTGELLENYLKPRLMEPLGIKGYDWEKSPDGLNTAGYGLRVSTEDIARFGQFYLQKGKWQSKQLLPESWIAEATAKQTASQTGDNDWSQGYGYQFWRCKPGFYRGDGAFGQFCMVMPEQDAVLVMTCESFDLQKSMNVAYQTILPALKNAALPENAIVHNNLKNELSKLELSVPKGNISSKLQSKYSDKFFKIEKNSFGITRIGFGLFEDGGVLRIAEDENGNFKKIGFGWEKWKVNSPETKNYFPVNNRTAVPSKIAATATWINDNTLQVNLKFVEGVHGDKLTFAFEDNKVTLTLLNSVAENSKNTPEKREKLTGILI
jgi:hypothetical protein